MNKQRCERQSYYGKSNEQGSALIPLLVFASIVAFAAAGIANITKQHQHMTKIILDQSKAQQIAEGAASRVLAHVANDSHHIVNPPPAIMSGEMGSGTYEVDMINGGSGIVIIEATGMVNEQSRTVKIHFREPQQFPGRNYAMLSNGDIKLRGNGNIGSSHGGGGDIHANQDIDIAGNTSISGNAVAVGDVKAKDGAVGGEIYSGADPVSFPRLNLDKYYAIAEAHGEIHEGDLHIQNSRSPDGGVLWVVGDVHISGGGGNDDDEDEDEDEEDEEDDDEDDDGGGPPGGGPPGGGPPGRGSPGGGPPGGGGSSGPIEFTGLLVATGDIKQASHYTHYRSDEIAPIAMISRDGNIKLAGQTDIDNSLIYAKSGQVDIVGGSGSNGAIAAWSDIFVRGNWTVDNNIENAWNALPKKECKVLAWEL